MEKRLKEILKAMMPDRDRAEVGSLFPGQRVKVGGNEPASVRMTRTQRPQEKTPPPRVVREAGFEWLWRTVRQPSRMARLPALAAFSARVLVSTPTLQVKKRQKE
jgi:hypothetical protein